MRTITCMDCGHEIAEDDFIMQQCPVCDGFMQPSRLNKKVDTDLGNIVRINIVHTSALVDGD